MVRIARILEGVIEGVGRINAWIVVLLILWVVADVFLRYVFSLGWVWAQQMEWHFLSPIALIGMSYALRHDDHVRVDMFYDKYPFRIRRAVDFAAGVLVILVAMVMLDLSIPFVLKSFAVMEGSYEPGGMPYRFILKGFIPVGFALLVLQGLATCILAAHDVVQGRKNGD